MDDEIFIVDSSLENSTALMNIQGNTIYFQIKNEILLELRENGEILVKGKLIEEDKELVEGMRAFLRRATLVYLK